MRRTLTAAGTVLLVASLLTPPAVAQDDPAPVDGRYQQEGDAGGFFSVMPPGQDGVLNGAEIVAAQGGSYPEHFNDQTGMYEDLVYEGGVPIAGEHGEPLLGITDGDIERFFIDGSFGAAGEVEPIAVPEECGAGVVAFRDTAFGVPHIYGDTREGAQCANGYATAQDRLFVMDLLRHVGYARMSEFLGASEANKAMDRAQLLVAPYTDEEYEAQVAALCESADAEAVKVCADGTAYIAGVNAYIAEARRNPSMLPGEYAALQIAPEDFTLRDIIATASLVGGRFGTGGGSEAANSMFMAALMESHGPEEARQIFDDLKAADDADAQTTVDEPFPYMVHPDVDESTTALLAPGTFVSPFEGPAEPPLGTDELPPAAAPTTLGIADGPFGPIDLRTPLGMSNAILATADVTDSGLPIAVFGPQTGYFTPQLLVETDLHAPGLDARGTAFAGTNIYVQLGRGRDYAWSATSASGDLVDQWALELCDPAGGEATIESTGYVWDGVCAEIPVLTHTQVAKPTAGGIPDSPTPDDVVVTMEIGRIPELDDAPVVGRAVTTEGVPVAIAEQRSTYKSELASAIGFMRINDPDFMTEGVESFNRAFDGVDLTFNWFYVDDTDIAYRHTCLCPIRDPDTDPDLLTWGGRGHQWTGEFLTPDQQPQGVNPDSGYFANWNNKQAPGFRSNDDAWKHHAADRREHLSVRMAAAIAAGRPLTRADMVNIAEDAGTVDLNPQEIYPLALEIMAGEAPAVGDAAPALLEAMRDRLAAWVEADGHRRDLDRDGVYDHAVAVAIGDAWVRPLIDRVLGDDLGTAGETPVIDLWPEGIEDHPRLGVGSAYNSGRIRVLEEDFWAVLGRGAAEPRNYTYCGDGTVAGCATVLWEALADAAALLQSTYEGDEEQPCDFPDAYRFGTPTVEEWVYPADCDNIIQKPAGVVAAPPMRWVNRPTYHQVAEVSSSTGRIGGLSRLTTATAASRHAFPGGAETVVLAAAGTFADAVAGTPLAAQRDAPLLLTERDALSAATEREVVRLGATSAVVLGGTAAVSEAVVTRLGELGLEVERIAGGSRYETAVAIAEALGQTERFVLANAVTFADALAAGPFAAADDRAILLTDGERMPDVVVEALGAATDVVIAGGEAAVGSTVADLVAAGGTTVTRAAGPTRYDTAVALAQRGLEAGASAATSYVVTGEDFPDALAAGAVAARTGGSLLLLNPNGLDHAPAARDLLVAQAERVWFVGGPVPLPSPVRAALEGLR